MRKVRRPAASAPIARRGGRRSGGEPEITVPPAQAQIRTRWHDGERSAGGGSGSRRRQDCLNTSRHERGASLCFLSSLRGYAGTATAWRWHGNGTAATARQRCANGMATARQRQQHGNGTATANGNRAASARERISLRGKKKKIRLAEVQEQR